MVGQYFQSLATGIISGNTGQAYRIGPKMLTAEAHLRRRDSNPQLSCCSPHIVWWVWTCALRKKRKIVAVERCSVPPWILINNTQNNVTYWLWHQGIVNKHGATLSRKNISHYTTYRNDCSSLPVCGKATCFNPWKLALISVANDTPRSGRIQCRDLGSPDPP